jgi:predicted glutamine amidotransferase
MCELLGMSANVPTDVCFSFSGLIRRGGATGPHKDGWGITFYEGKGCRTFLEPKPSAYSEIARLVQEYPIKSKTVIAHIRRANVGAVCLENTHPFSRELWGENWTFAHNGRLQGVKKKKLSYYRPIGTTDSEHAFCWIMDSLRRHFTRKPSAKALTALIRKLLNELNELGVCNVLLSDGAKLYAYCSTALSYITRKAPFGRATLVDKDVQVDFQKVTSSKDIVTVIATRPLTNNEYWDLIPPGELKVFLNGQLI